MRSLSFALALLVGGAGACSDAQTPLSRAQRVVTRVFEGGALPMQGEAIPSDPERARELALVPIAIRASTSIVMEEAFQRAGDTVCVSGRLVGAPAEPTLSMIMHGDAVVHASVERRCRCAETCAF